MERISRRTFARRLTALPFLPAIVARGQDQQPTIPQATSGTIAGYAPTDDERAAMRRFLARQEELLTPLRKQALPNDLAPASVFHPVHRPGSFDAAGPRRRSGRQPAEKERDPGGPAHD
jgi:hypothetical protein